jgi:hypothetical protein
MTRDRVRTQEPCSCGSGRPSTWQFDGQGIPLCRTCTACHARQMARYRSDILGPYTQADVDEPIEPEEY